MTKTTSYLSIHRAIIMALSALMFISLIAYIGFTVATVFATAGRSVAVKQADALTADISSLERSYITLEEGVTAAEASARGFVRPTSVTVLPLKSTSSFSFETSVQ